MVGKSESNLESSSGLKIPQKEAEKRSPTGVELL
jgi:hypothetical protein